mgnify:CR=1 FL=1
MFAVALQFDVTVDASDGVALRDAVAGDRAAIEVEHVAQGRRFAMPRNCWSLAVMPNSLLVSALYDEIDGIQQDARA